MQNKQTELVILATAKAKAGKEAELESALRECAGPTREQPGCIQFMLLRAANDKGTIVGYERWASEADHERHLKGPHVERLMTRMADILATPPDILAFTAIDE